MTKIARCGLAVGLATVVLQSFIGGFAAAAGTQNSSNSARGLVQATIVRALSLANTSGMNFGTVLANELGGTVSLSPSGDYTALGVTVANSSDVVPGKFRIFGTHSQAYSITFPQAAIFSGSGDIRVVTFMHDAGGTPTLDNDGKGLFNMGATLRLGAHLPAGTYYGKVDVIISNH